MITVHTEHWAHLPWSPGRLGDNTVHSDGRMALLLEDSGCLAGPMPASSGISETVALALAHTGGVLVDLPDLARAACRILRMDSTDSKPICMIGHHAFDARFIIEIALTLPYTASCFYDTVSLNPGGLLRLRGDGWILVLRSLHPSMTVNDKLRGLLP